MNVKKNKFEHWSADDSAMLYGINDWGAGYFHVNDKGELRYKSRRDQALIEIYTPAPLPPSATRRGRGD